jgi:23S rRNA pseudouridine1911/1915/1917 synthase
MVTSKPTTLIIPQEWGGFRLDVALQNLMPEYSRSRIQSWIKDGFVQVDHQSSSSKQKVWGGEIIFIDVPTAPEQLAFEPEAIPLNIVYEDDVILVINKPAGMVVHPAAGNWHGTLLNAILHHVPQAKDIPRAGIVHRLDKDTSGLLVVAKSVESQTHLVRQLQARTVKREYRTIVWGQIWKNGTVDQPIGRHPYARTKMAINRMGKPAVTRYEVLERFGVHTYLRCLLETGRTHQIRVHMQYLKAPIVGDPVYGYRGIIPHRLMTESLQKAVLNFGRQALHAIKLGLVHPKTGQEMSWQVELPDDMKALLEEMRVEEMPYLEEEAFWMSSDEETQEAELDAEDEDWIDEEDDVE